MILKCKKVKILQNIGKSKKTSYCLWKSYSQIPQMLLLFFPAFPAHSALDTSSRHSRQRRPATAAACIPARYLYYYFYFCLVEYGAKSKLTPITSQPPSLAGTKRSFGYSLGEAIFMFFSATQQSLLFSVPPSVLTATQGVLGIEKDFSGSLATYDC